MPRNGRPPSYRLHKARRCAVVTIDGRNHYLGPYGSLESFQRFLELFSEWLTSKFGTVVPSTTLADDDGLTLNELILAYWEFAKSYYVKNGQPTDEQACIKSALRPLRRLFGHTSIQKFRPTDLEAVRQAMIEAKLSRGVINSYVSRIRRCFRWGVSKQIVSESVYRALESLDGLKKGRSLAREMEPVGPVSDSEVDAVLPFLSNPLKAMVQFQLLTGCRPSEVCLLRPCDIDRTEVTWCYRPESHKTEHHNRQRLVFIGPRAQALLASWLLRPNDSFCFSPREAVSSENSSSPKAMSQTEKARRPRPSRRGNHYTSGSYRRAIARACDKAGIDHWAPNQLRHSRATGLRRQFGLEGAQSILGHSQIETTEIYAERDAEKARAIMQEVG